MNPVALIIGSTRMALLGNGIREVWPTSDGLRRVAELERDGPRWAWWSAAETARPLVDAGIRPTRAWDVAEAHRLLFGGWEASPGVAWAAVHDLAVESVPGPPTGDLFEAFEAQVADDALVRPDGYLRADATTWATTDDRLVQWADALLRTARMQRERATGRLPTTVHSESAAAVLGEELRHDGLPVDRARLTALVEPLSGSTRERDALVLRHVRGHAHTDLRNPAQVRELLAAAGIEVPSTRKHVLEPYRDAHPVVAALLQWRKEERIATTYGLRWIENHIGPDDRLRGTWTACDGAAGRMTAEAGLHNLPVMLRSGVRAEPGHVFVRADLGQIEPRVLAVVSRDPAFAAATRDDDLYAPVAARLGVERATAKVAVLAAMYGGRSGAAAEALRGLQREYPVAMRLLDRAFMAGVNGEDVRTYGGRLIRTGDFLTAMPVGADRELDSARGRFARNAVIQGAAAELFKAWAATVRATTGHLDARIVLCLHDELLVHVPAENADATAAAVDRALQDASRRWSEGAPVRFVADTSVIERWSQAKD